MKAHPTYPIANFYIRERKQKHENISTFKSIKLKLFLEILMPKFLKLIY